MKKEFLIFAAFLSVFISCGKQEPERKIDPLGPDDPAVYESNVLVPFDGKEINGTPLESKFNTYGLVKDSETLKAPENEVTLVMIGDPSASSSRRRYPADAKNREVRATRTIPHSGVVNHYSCNTLTTTYDSF